MLRAAGFTDAVERDVTDEYLETARGWLREASAREDALRALQGDAAFAQRHRDRRRGIAAIEDGLLRRSLFIAC